MGKMYRKSCLCATNPILGLGLLRTGEKVTGKAK